MYKAPGHALDSGKGQTKAALAAEKDEVAKRFAGALIIRTDGAIRAPVVTLQGEKANLYNVIEKHLRTDAVVGAERFWKLIRAMYNPNLDTWRPRVNGVQLKALQGARLPETDQEWHCVKVVLDTIADWIREDSTPEAFLQELKELVAYCENWWDNRTKREGTCSTFLNLLILKGGLCISYLLTAMHAFKHFKFELTFTRCFYPRLQAVVAQ